jgi:UDPglucose 6-dehydrogenase
MNIAVIGTGYVGLVTGACLADFGHSVVCVDSNLERIESLRRFEVPFYEPGLAELVQRQATLGRLRFITSIPDAMRDTLVAFLAVGTPESSNGEADLSQVLAVASEIAECLDSYRVIVTKSTVPVGTGRMLQRLFQTRLGAEGSFDVVSNPEFLREGSAIADFLRPDRVVVGTASPRAAAIMREIFRPLYLIETPMLFTNVETAEMVKYASNAFLAVKIGFINSIANLCDRTGADVHVVAKGMGLDKRIGPKFLHPGPGYGGSCFPKDTRALAALGDREGVPQPIVRATIESNDRQIEVALDKIAAAAQGLRGKTIGLLGLAFKPNTSDVRESPAIRISRRLIDAGATIQAYDPVAKTEALGALGDKSTIRYADDAYEAAVDVDALVIATEWNEFRGLDLGRLRGVLRRPAIVDLRNVLDPIRVRSEGFVYYSTGRDVLSRLPAAEYDLDHRDVLC